MLGERVWAKKFELGRDPFLENRVLTSLARKMPKNAGHSVMHSRFPVFSRFGSSWSFSCVFGSHVLAVGFIFFPWIGGRFCNARYWVVFLTFLELLVHFPFTFLWFHVFFTMVVKSHSRFWLCQRLMASRTGYLGRFSLLWVMVANKLQDCVFFPYVVSRFCCYVWGCAIRFPCLSCESWINCRGAIVGFQTVWGVRILAWLLDKPGARNHTGRARGLAFFSITPE